VADHADHVGVLREAASDLDCSRRIGAVVFRAERDDDAAVGASVCVKDGELRRLAHRQTHDGLRATQGSGKADPDESSLRHL
jgi:hypothetical protein